MTDPQLLGVWVALTIAVCVTVDVLEQLLIPKFRRNRWGNHQRDHDLRERR